MPLAYADDIDINDSRESEVAVAFSKFAEETPLDPGKWEQDKVPFIIYSEGF